MNNRSDRIEYVTLILRESIRTFHTKLCMYNSIKVLEIHGYHFDKRDTEFDRNELVPLAMLDNAKSLQNNILLWVK